MTNIKKFLGIIIVLVSINVLAFNVVPQLQDDRTRQQAQQKDKRKGPATLKRGGKASADSLKKELSGLSLLTLEDDTIPDSLLHPRWKVQRSVPVTIDDVDKRTADLSFPENIKQDVVYNDTLDRYFIGSRMGGGYLSTPIIMTPDEYRKWSERQEMNRFFRDKNDEIVKAKGKEKFSFSDMHFSLGPAEKIFGPGGVRIKTQGTAELKLGATMKEIDNPSLPIRNRKTTTMNFDEKINLNVNGKVGDKVNMNLNYNTDATFDFDSQNLKLKYEGKEDEIIKLVEAGNVSFPSNSSLVKGASSLFGIRTDMQFGKLKLQTVISQKKSSSKSVSSKGGVQLTPFEIDASDYEENRHFFLSRYFREKYDAAMKTLPNLTTGITINRVEIWVTNKQGNTTNTRNIVALTDLGENTRVSNPMWGLTGSPVPSNNANSEYSTIVNSYSAARDIDQTSTVLDGIPGFVGGADYEKLQSARLLSSSEYSVNQALGYVSLKSSLQTDQVLAVAYEYTAGGQTYQVGEFASDMKDVQQAIFVKALKNTSNNPRQGNWDLMMKNVYYLASSVEKDKFRLDVKYQSDTTGVYLSYIPEQQVKDLTMIKLLGADRLDNNNKVHSNGYFDFVEGYTVSNGRVFFPEAEPFGRYLYNQLVAKGISPEKAAKYSYTELYDSTKTVAKQIAEKDKYRLTGQFRGTSANVISLGAYNVPQGSVVVTAGGVTLSEGSDYSVDYSAGEVTILNQSIIDAGTAVNVSLESNTDYAQQRKTMLGLNWEYDFTKNFQLSGTFQHLSEQALTTKVSMGSEPLNNTLWGLNINWKKESQWLTNVLDKIPFLHCTQPSQISFTGEFAQLIAGQASGTQDNASYIDDFENTKNTIDVSTPSSWIISSVPTMFPNYNDKTTLQSGFQRALLAWYNIDPLFTRRSSSLTPGHIKSDLHQLSNHYVREVYVRELFPNRDQSSYNGATATLPILNLAFYPSERGPYNFNPNLNSDGTLPVPAVNWGGMMRRLDTSDFETANIEYIEFWMLDPFIYSNKQPDAAQYGGDFYINLGEVSEDVLRDGKKFYESGMPVDGSSSFTTTQWGKIPTQSTVTYSFATSAGARAKQDVGFNGLTDEEEQNFAPYRTFLDAVQARVTGAARDSILADPANDNYHYFRGSDYDKARTPILARYKRINNPQGNSPDSDSRSESYDTSYKTTPDVEDINQDYTLNEYEKYYQYRVSIRPQDLVVGQNYIVDKRETSVKLRNDTTETVTWYQFRIPVDDYERNVGGITDFTSIRFMRMFLTDFQKPIVLRFGSLDLVRGEWRIYEQSLSTGSESGKMAVSAVNIEENNDRVPVNYVLPPGIRREQDPTQPQLTESNEQSLDIQVTNLSNGEAKAVYKNTNLDLRQYKRLQMFVHANAFEQNSTNLQDNQLAVFVRFGSDYKSNYYEYEIPLKLTAPGHYDRYSGADCKLVWPEENMLDIPLSAFTQLKKDRNKAKAIGQASYSYPFTAYDSDKPNNKITIVGNPTLGEVRTMIIGVRNLASEQKSGEIWVNELRLKEYNNSGGWAAQGNLNVQLSDVGSVNVQGKYVTEGFGGLEDGVAQRAQDNYKSYSVTTNFELGKFFPDKAKVSIPLYYSVTKEETRPKYNPLDTDMLLDDALDAMEKHEKDSIESIAVTKTTNTNFSLSNMKVGIATKKHPMPYDPANFSFSYSHSHRHTSGETTIYENEDNWRGSMNYSYTPVYKAFEPFKKIKSRSKWYDILKRFGLNWLPQNITFNTEMLRNYYELQERDMESLENSELPLTFSEQFLWNREFSIRWDLTKNLHMSFNSATHAEIEEPYTPVNKDLYPDQYTAWKDSVWTSIKHFGRPLDYNQNFTASYQVPINLIPVFDWITADANYNATYNWTRGTDQEDGQSLGNVISNNRTLNINGALNFEKLYNHIPFLKKANERFNKRTNNATKKKRDRAKSPKEANEARRNLKEAKELPKNKKSFEKEITLLPDTTMTVNHGKKSKRLIVSAKTKDGKMIKLKYKTIDSNKIKITSKVDSATTVKLLVTPKEPLENKSWYKTMQVVARGLMLVRNFNLSYRNQYGLSLPGFLPEVGNVFGQRRGDIMSPGLDFAFGFVDDSYVQKSAERGWLLMADSVATPATSSKTEDLQLRMTLEPVKDLKIDLNASRTMTTAKSVQYMYQGMPTTQSGTFTMTTISLGSAFESMGDANNGYHSASFEKFCNSLEGFRQRVENQYQNAVYPAGSTLAGNTFNPENGTVSKYSADVMIPAFLSTYTSMGGKSLDIFPTLSRLLPNWSVRYSGLVRLPWFSEVFKSFNINHAYKSVYAVGSYSSFSTYQEFMNGLGFVTDATTGNPTPSSMFNVSTVSINESFSPLLGVDMTFHNNLTAKLEYRQTRVLSLSMTSVQLNESSSNDWVIGMGYKVNNFDFFGLLGNGNKARKVKGKKTGTDEKKSNNNSRNNRSGFNTDLNLRLDLSFRKQAAICRDIASMTSAASSGNSAFKLSFAADYTLSRLLTMSFYYDRQTNTPLLSSSSYPTTTQDFGLSLKFSLTR
ncbi:cell surface protein SprA [uncultured Prevotella sp.]|uniref:T9SS outer membrane translocon Sov/SprA n=1 Tax=uncultured Prevotella sp. TaxID=159272 RepID=UPI002598D989|nr:cell surface protein SprA [uncultured Prevotella sp.]